MAGCALIEPNSKLDLFVEDGEKELPSIKIPRDALELEIIFIERPVDDPLLGSPLWKEVDQIGSLPPETRTRLRKNGLRFGHLGSNPPQALQTMLGLNYEITSNPDEKKQKRFSGRRIVLRSGAETEVQTSPYYKKCSIELTDEQDEEKQSLEEFQNARCVFRVKAKKMMDGWAELELSPEIHHGQQRWRPVATDNRWMGRTTQKVRKLFGQKFTVRLTVGEMVIFTSQGDKHQSLGYHFFRGAEENEPVQRLLIVRLSNMKQLEKVFSNKGR